jgi:hypothetical protein
MRRHPEDLRVGTRVACALLLSVFACAVARGATLEGRVTIVDRGGAPGDPSAAIVWLEGVPGPPPTPGRAAITMRDKKFDPPIVHLPVGSLLTFPNADPILHNVFSVSAGNRFDLGLYARGAGREVVLRTPGLVRIFCNVHPQMEAYVVVTPGPYASRPASDGRFSIPDLPAGRYTVRVWHERGGSEAREVEIAAGGSAGVDFTLDASTWRRRPHLDKDGRPYQGGSREPY